MYLFLLDLQDEILALASSCSNSSCLAVAHKVWSQASSSYATPSIASPDSRDKYVSLSTYLRIAFPSWSFDIRLKREKALIIFHLSSSTWIAGFTCDPGSRFCSRFTSSIFVRFVCRFASSVVDEGEAAPTFAGISVREMKMIRLLPMTEYETGNRRQNTRPLVESLGAAFLLHPGRRFGLLAL